jgi:integrase
MAKEYTPNCASTISRSDLGWILAPIPKKAWPRIESKSRRAITRAEFDRFIAAEQNIERRRYYELLWETGASQTDAALLTAENIDWTNGVLVYDRKKLRGDHEPCQHGGRCDRGAPAVTDYEPRPR